MNITITYECDEPEQKMVLSVSETEEEGTVQIDVDFEPAATGGTKDPYGFMGDIISMIEERADALDVKSVEVE